MDGTIAKNSSNSPISKVISFASPQVRLKMNDKKTEPVPILLLRGARSFFDAKKMKKKILLAWTLEIIQFIRYPIQMDRTEKSNFFGEKVDFL